MPELFVIVGGTSFYGSNFIRYVHEHGDETISIGLRDHTERPQVKRGQYVVVFAAMNIVEQSWQHPLQYIDVNFARHAPLILLAKDARRRLKKYIHVSTPEVYGNTPTPVDETCAFNPSTPYAVTRAATDMFLMAYHKNRGLPALITRTANIYGPGQQAYRVIPAAFEAKRLDDRLPLHGGGTTRRSFIHVRDACAATYLLAKHGNAGETYHIATQETVTIAELCQKIGVMTREAPERRGKDQQYLMRSEKLRRLGWSDTITLDKGLEEYAEYAHRAAHDKASRQVPALPR